MRVRIEQDKSGRAHCRNCGKLIPRGTQRLSWTEQGWKSTETLLFCKECGREKLSEEISNLEKVLNALWME